MHARNVDWVHLQLTVEVNESQNGQKAEKRIKELPQKH